MAEVATVDPTYLAQTLDALRVSSNTVLRARLAEDAEWDPQPFLTSSAALFAALNAINRNAALYSKQCRDQSAKARSELEAACLRLENLLYRKDHLKREIKAAEGFETKYESVALQPVEEFLAFKRHEAEEVAAANAAIAAKMETDDAEEGETKDVIREVVDVDALATQPHELMLHRLDFELAERKRLEEVRKALVARKAALIKENEIKKRRLEELEIKLEAVSATCAEVLKGMQS